MSEKKIFGLTQEQLKKQSGKISDSPENQTPIRKGETLEPCLRGAKKILADKGKTEMMRRIYRG